MILDKAEWTGLPNDADPARISQAAAMQAIVDGIIARLDDAGVPHCLLRNQDRIPWGLVDGSDLDILVADSTSLHDLVDLMADLHPVHISPRRRGFVTMFFPAGALFLRLDLTYGDVEWRGASLVSNADILANREKRDGMMVACPADQAFLAWFDRLLRNGRFKTRYTGIIELAATSQPELFRHRISHAFGHRLADQLLNLVLEGQMERSESLVSACRRAIWLRSIKRHPLRLVRRCLDQIADAYRHRAAPTGLNVVLLGPDGVGKSTTARSLSALPESRLPFGDVKHVTYYHRILPPPGQIIPRLLGRPNKSQRDRTQPHSVPTLSASKSLLVSVYYVIDFKLCEIFWKRKELGHMNLIVNDRHPLEIDVDPRRYRYSQRNWMTRWMSRMAPQPDIAIVLDAPADVIQQRKQELTFEETLRQLRSFRRLAETFKHGYVIDSTQPIEKVLNDIIAAITEVSCIRTRQRFGHESTSWPRQSKSANGLSDMNQMPVVIWKKRTKAGS